MLNKLRDTARAVTVATICAAAVAIAGCATRPDTNAGGGRVAGPNVATSATPAPNEPTSTPPKPSLSQILSDFQDFASKESAVGAPPAQITYAIAGRLDDAVKLGLDGETDDSLPPSVNNGTAVIMVAIGQFVAIDAKIPPNTATPKGTVLTEVTSLLGGYTTDWSVGDRTPDIAKLGTVKSLRP